MFDITAYGASTGATDNAPAINAAITACSLAGGGVVHVPGGLWHVTSQIVMQENVTLQGESATFGFMGHPASTLVVDWGYGSGMTEDPAHAAVAVVGGSGVRNLGFSYPAQSPTANALECAPAIMWSANTASKQNLVIENCYFEKAYVACDIRGHGSSMPTMGVTDVRFVGNSGSPLMFGLRINMAVNWCRIEANLFHASMFAPWPNTLAQWACSNGILYDIGRTDWLQFNNNKNWGYQIAYNLDMRGTYYPNAGPLQFQGNSIDAAFIPFMLNGQSDMIEISGCVITAISSVTNAAFWGVIMGVGGGVKDFAFTGNYIFGPNLGWVWLGQPSQIVDSVLVSGNMSNAIGGNTPCYVATAKKITYTNNFARGYANPALLTAPSIINTNNH